MNGFEFISTRSVEDAGELLANGTATQIIAGGTDLLGESQAGYDSSGETGEPAGDR